jgi:arylsulfatase A-like enzyme
MAEILGDNGFRTYAIFSNINASPKFGYDQGFEKYNFVKKPTARNVRLQSMKALRSLKRKKPFFLYLHFMDPHSPYWPPEPYDKHFDPLYKGEITGQSHKQLDQIMLGKVKFSQQDLEHLVAQYDAEILYFDSELRALFADIESLGLLENSIIIFTSDHGEEFFEHGKLLHGYTLYQEQLRVPLIILGKGIPKRRIRSTVSSLDILPSLLSLLNIKENTRFQGRDITPILDKKAINASPLFAEASLNAVFTIKFKSVILDDWKYINDLLNNSEELYNLKENPAENNNLASKNPDQLTKMRDMMNKFIQSTVTGLKRKLIPLDKKSKKQLKSLGYIN